MLVTFCYDLIKNKNSNLLMQILNERLIVILDQFWTPSVVRFLNIKNFYDIFIQANIWFIQARGLHKPQNTWMKNFMLG